MVPSRKRVRPIDARSQEVGRRIVDEYALLRRNAYFLSTITKGGVFRAETRREVLSRVDCKTVSPELHLHVG